MHIPIKRCCECRLLNHLPAARMTATALEAFLKAAGFRMNRVYGRQFQKLLGHIDSVFLPDLEKQGDPEARPVMSRCATSVQWPSAFLMVWLSTCACELRERSPLSVWIEASVRATRSCLGALGRTARYQSKPSAVQTIL